MHLISFIYKLIESKTIQFYGHYDISLYYLQKKKWCHDVNGGGKCQEKNLNCSLAQLLQLDPLNLVGINY